MDKAIEKLIRAGIRAAGMNVRERAFLLAFRATQKRAAKTRRKWEDNGIHIPPFLIASITKSCNLACKGCYAMAFAGCGEKGGQSLTAAEWGNIFTEAQHLGIAFILLAGGEPLLRRDILAEAIQRPHILFPIFTNGTLLDRELITLFQKHKNLLPVLSLEGTEKETDERRGKGVYAAIEEAMGQFKKRRTFFAASITVNRENIATVTEDGFVRGLMDRGCKLIFYVEYVAADPGTEALTLEEEERTYLKRRTEALRRNCSPVPFLCFPGDEEKLGGCLGAGRGFFHIGVGGDAEACPFSPFSDINLKNNSLLAAIQSPLFHNLAANGFLNQDHRGGCALLPKAGEVRAMADESRTLHYNY